jgi:multimeric flavodoxin WrbA
MQTSILAIHAGERPNGNSYALLEQARKGAEEAGAKVEILVVREKNFAPCVSCGGCAPSGECAVRDDMTDIYRLLRKADHIIVATPIYFRSLPGRFKCLIDRCQAFWQAKYVLKLRVAANPSGVRRLGAFLACCGSPKGEMMFPPAEKTISAFFNCLDVELRYKLYVPGTDTLGAILKQRDVMQKARQIGRALAEEKSTG